MATRAEKIKEIRDKLRRIKELRDRVQSSSSSSSSISSSSRSRSSSSSSSSSSSNSDKIKEIRDKLRRIKELRDKIRKSSEEEKEAEQLQEEIVEAQDNLTEEDVEEVRREFEAGEQASLPTTRVEIDGLMFELPEEFVEKDYFKRATEAQKGMMAYSYNALVDQGQDLQKVVSALDYAAQQSDPYMAQQVRFFEDSLARSFGYLVEDYKNQKGIVLRKMGNTAEDLRRQEKMLQRRKEQVQEDLVYSKEELDLDTQRAMEDAVEKYDLEIENTRNQLSQSGLTYSSIRSRAEKMIEDAHEDVVEDIETKERRQLRNLEIEAQRAQQDYDYQLETQRIQAERQREGYTDTLGQLRSQTQQKITDTLRKGESYLGTEKLSNQLGRMDLPETLDFSLMGGITATGLKKDRQADILNRAQLFLNQ